MKMHIVFVDGREFETKNDIEFDGSMVYFVDSEGMAIYEPKDNVQCISLAKETKQPTSKVNNMAQNQAHLKEEIVEFVFSDANEPQGAWGDKMIDLIEEHGFDAVYAAYKLGVDHGELSQQALEQLAELK